MITHGAVSVTTRISDSWSASSISESSSDDEINDDDDSHEWNGHEAHGNDYDDKFVGAFSAPATIDGERGSSSEEGRLRGGAGSNRDRDRDASIDSLDKVFLPVDGALAHEQEENGDIPPKKDNHPLGVLLADPSAGKRSLSSEADELRRGNEEPPHVGDNADIDRDTARGTVGVDIDAILSDCSSQPEFPDPHDREGRRSGLDIPPTEKILTRLYEGHCFGEMALIYDEPRNASVRATTYTTCVYLHKDAFRKHLGDKTFNKLIEQAALKTAFFREQREMVTEHHNKDSLLATAAKDESWKCFTSARALATVQGSARSSFRCTEQLKFAGDTKGETHGRLVNDYRVCEKVGEGSFGAVYKVVHVHSGEINAMKVCIQSPRHIYCH